jgi:Ran GTPase-activating protein (RanGAP) involved in mRNA processing and transport
MTAPPEWRVELDRVLREGEQAINLSTNYMGDTGANEVAEKLLRGTEVTHVDLSDNAITDAGAAALAELLRDDTIALEFLNLNDNNISLNGVRSLAEGLKKNTTLTFLAALRQPRGGPVPPWRPRTERSGSGSGSGRRG